MFSNNSLYFYHVLQQATTDLLYKRLIQLGVSSSYYSIAIQVHAII